MNKDKAKALVDAILKNDLAQAKNVFRDQMTVNVGSKIGNVRESVIAKMFSKNAS